MKYKVIKSDYFQDFENSVNNALRAGWGLRGELVVVINNKDVVIYYQVVIKEAEEPIKP